MTSAILASARPPTVWQGRGTLLLVGTAAIFFPLVYLVSDMIEVVQGDFGTLRLTLTYIGEAGFPLFVVALCAVLRHQIRWWGLLGGLTYAYSFVFFTGTVLWALVDHTRNWEVLASDFGAWMTIHGAIMVVGGVALGLAIARDSTLPAWTGYALAGGVILVAAASGLGNLERTCAAAVADMAFAGMGLSLIRQGRTSKIV